MKTPFVHRLKDARHGLLGYLVIDSKLNNSSAGGLRMDAHTSVDELKALARTMTLKYAFTGFPFGGAKAALLFDSEKISQTEKKEVIIAAGKALSSYVKGYKYMIGTDLGTTHEDITLLLKAAGAPYNIKNNRSEFYTALTLFLFAERVSQEINLNLRTATVAIEGFGKVGSNVAKLFAEKGSKIVAVSTSEGAIYKKEGLPVSKLIELRNKHGSQFVNHVPAQKISKEELLTLPIDILCPCAKSWSVHELNAHKIKAKLVVPGANIPLTKTAEEILTKRGVTVVPDFAANCGGVLSAPIEKLVLSQEKTEAIIRKEFLKKIEKVLRVAKEKKLSLPKAALEIAINNFDKAKADEKKIKSSFYRMCLAWLRKGIVPKWFIRLVGPYYVKWKLRH